MSVLRSIADLAVSLLRGLVGMLWDPVRRAAARGDVGKRTWVAIISIVVIVASVVSMAVRMHRPAGPRVNNTPFIAVGQVLAEETARLLRDKGKIVVVTAEPGRFDSANARGRVEGFQRTLRAHREIRVVAVETVKPVMPASPETRLSAEVYEAILREHRDADAIVSFVGVPVLSDEQIRELPSRIPKCVALDTSGVDMERLLRSDVVQVVAVGHVGRGPASGPEPKTAREWFDRYYQIVAASAADPGASADPPWSTERHDKTNTR